MGNCSSCTLGQMVQPGIYICSKKLIAHHSIGNCDFFKGKNKFNAVRVVDNESGMKFDSKKEKARFMELCMLEKSGVIQNLQRQVKFEIVPKNGDERASFYVADFVYVKADGKKVIEDLKSAYTRKLPLFRLKWKLVKYIYKDYECVIVV